MFIHYLSAFPYCISTPIDPLTHPTSIRGNDLDMGDSLLVIILDSARLYYTMICYNMLYSTALR